MVPPTSRNFPVSMGSQSEPSPMWAPVSPWRDGAAVKPMAVPRGGMRSTPVVDPASASTAELDCTWLQCRAPSTVRGSEDTAGSPCSGTGPVPEGDWSPAKRRTGPSRPPSLAARMINGMQPPRGRGSSRRPTCRHRRRRAHLGATVHCKTVWSFPPNERRRLLSAVNRTRVTWLLCPLATMLPAPSTAG